MRLHFHRYLKILNKTKNDPSFDYLSKLVRSHIINIPFENISKLYYYNTQNLNFIPDFDLYLHGIEKNSFGGTCYSNNYYFNNLLKYLGFEVMLCGADMNAPDLHLVNIVKINGLEYLVDVGYGAPFYIPIPLKLTKDYQMQFGNELYKVSRRIGDGNIVLEKFTDNSHKHGYIIKPYNRSFDEFEEIIIDSFRPSATFLNRITAIKYSVNCSVSIRNYSLIKMTEKSINILKLQSREEIVQQVHKYFNIPINIILESIKSINDF